ncbi:MAG: hypothetical protein K2X32_03605 [Phycisphaerales bacterium]|nr:hypothetical protein [Phycisphaerales bacterium]
MTHLAALCSTALTLVHASAAAATGRGGGGGRGGGLGRLLGGGASPAPLDAPSQLEEYLLVWPWPLAAILIASGLVGFFLLNRMGKPARVSVGVLALGVGLGIAVIVLASRVTTAREAVMSRTREFIAAAATADRAAADPLLAPDLELRGLGSGRIIDRARLLTIIDSDMKTRWVVKEHSIGTLRSIIDGPNTARSQVEVHVTPEQFPMSMSSWWLLRWRMDPNGTWRIMSIEPQQIDGVKSLGNFSL